MKWLILFVALLVALMPAVVIADLNPWLQIEIGQELVKDYQYLDFYGGFELGKNIFWFNAWGGTHTDMLYIGDLSFSPFMTNYLVGGAFSIGPVYISAEHVCNHVTMSSYSQTFPTSSLQDAMYGYAQRDYTRIGIGLIFGRRYSPMSIL